MCHGWSSGSPLPGHSAKNAMSELQCGPDYDVSGVWAKTIWECFRFSGPQERSPLVIQVKIFIFFVYDLLDEFLLYARHYNGKEKVPNIPLFFSWKIRLFGDKDISRKEYSSLSLTLPPYLFLQSVVYSDLWLQDWNLLSDAFIHSTNSCGGLAMYQALGQTLGMP